jgi:hypothetical protein
MPSRPACASTASAATFETDPEADEADTKGIPDLDVAAEPGPGLGV